MFFTFFRKIKRFPIKVILKIYIAAILQNDKGQTLTVGSILSNDMFEQFGVYVLLHISHLLDEVFGHEVQLFLHFFNFFRWPLDSNFVFGGELDVDLKKKHSFDSKNTSNSF